MGLSEHRLDILNMLQDAVREYGAEASPGLGKGTHVHASHSSIHVMSLPSALDRPWIEIDRLIDPHAENFGEGAIAAPEFEDWPRRLMGLEHLQFKESPKGFRRPRAGGQQAL